MKQGFLLKLLMGYFKASEVKVSGTIFQNIECELNKLIEDLDSSITNLKTIDTKNIFNGGVEKAGKVNGKLHSELRKKNSDAIKIMDYLNELKSIIEKSSSISTSTIKQSQDVLEYIKSCSFEALGFSSSNIHRMTTDDRIDRSKILILYQYWFKPLINSGQYEDFNKEFIIHIENKLNKSNDYSHIIADMKIFFEEQDTEITDVHFCDMFDIFNSNVNSKKFEYCKEKIFQYISSELNIIVGEEEAKTRGLSADERLDIFSRITEQLADDAEIYHLNLQSPQENYRALIRYRLSHILFENTGEDGSTYKALAYFISNRDFPGNIYIHPAAKIDKKVYLSEQVVIGSNCRIFQNCYIGKNVCIVPFYTGQKNLSEEDIILESGVIIDNLVKIVGRVHIGQKSYICTNNLVYNDIPAKTFFDGFNFSPISEKEYQNFYWKKENDK